MIFTRKSILLFYLCMLVSVCFGQSTAVRRAFNYLLAQNATTSAGVFTNDGTLIRTLWSNKLENAGSKKAYWDGLDDGGVICKGSNYVVKVLSNNLQYTWEGVVGNNSDELTGSKVHHHTEGFFLDMAVSEKYAYVANGYEEGGSSKSKFLLTNPRSNINVMAKGIDAKAVDTDDENVYWLGIDPNAGSKTFILVTRVKDDTEVTFPNGIKYKTVHGEEYKSVIGFLNAGNVRVVDARGIAVQKKGDYVFASFTNLNQIRVLNKKTGALVQVLSINQPQKITIDHTKNDLWVISGENKLQSFHINSNGTITRPLVTLPGLSRPLDVTINGKSAVVVDAGVSHQVKFFDKTTGSFLNAFGQEGGYRTNSEVKNDKFMFVNPKRFAGDTTASSYIQFEKNGSFWLGDQGNLRAMHFSSERKLIGTIMNLGYIYSCAVDPNNPKRVFANYLEFEVDYSKKLDNGKNGSWILKRNWMGGVISENDNQYVRMRNVTTLTNGRTYAVSRFKQNDKNINCATIVELVPGGTLRYTGLRFGPMNSGIRVVLNADGSLLSLSGTALGEEPTWYKYKLEGFDSKNNPEYSFAKEEVSAPKLTPYDPISGGVNSLAADPVTKTGVLVTYDPTVDHSGKRGIGYHLGAIDQKTRKWLWRTSHVTHPSYMGPFPNDGSFDIGNRVGNAGGFISITDQFIFSSYRGEFWKNSQTNKYNVHYDNGLMLGQFGTTWPDVRAEFPGISEAFPMMAGNALSGKSVQVGNSIYVYHSDESYHGGIHRWRIDGLNTVKEQAAVLAITAEKPACDGIDLMAELPYADALKHNVAGWSRYPAESLTQDQYRAWWNITTNYQTFKSGEKDILIRMAMSKGKYFAGTVKRTIGTFDNLKEWQLVGQLCYPEVSEPDTNIIKVLDANGKTICQIKRNHDLFFNNYGFLINPTSKNTVGYALRSLESFSISATPRGVSFSFHGKSITLPVYDKTSNWRRPKTIVFHVADRNGRAHAINVANLKFYGMENDNQRLSSGYCEFIAPEPPTVLSNDHLDIIEAKHEFGNNEIMVSQDGREFTSYKGPISVGNIYRPKGYWKFKIRENAMRIESQATLSNEFTSTLGVHDTAKISLKAHPNPITGNQFFLTLSNFLEGRYDIELVNLKGQVLSRRTIHHPGGTSKVSLRVGSHVMAHLFNVVVKGNGVLLATRMINNLYGAY